MAVRVERIELEDVQGIILRGYKCLPWTRFVLVQFADSGKGQGQWLATVAPVRDARQDVAGGDEAVHLAFTVDGLRKLGLEELALARFAPAFTQGMAARRELLGDHDERPPETWSWGAGKESVHALLLIYASEEPKRATLYDRLMGNAAEMGVHEVAKVDSWVPPGWDPKTTRVKEHFGFTDGIAQPHVAFLEEVQEATPGQGVLRRGEHDNTVAPGEFLLGYGNELKAVSPDGPTVVERESAAQFQLGRNGSYLVLRQLKQEVAAFWQFLDNEGPRDTLMLRAANMVGRWPSGAPLVTHPERDDPGDWNADDFGFLDERGELTRSCPAGCHIRRANPRDSLQQVGPKSSAVANQHRLIRRGRSYGPPLAASMDPLDFLERPEGPAEERGLMFMAFNADIERQFEFVQHSWVNGTNFVPSQKGEVDPLVGAQPKEGGVFTVPGDPVRRRLGIEEKNPLRRFVTTRGGAYFFMPGLRALRYLVSLAGGARPTGPAPRPAA
jgi:Dyp-type peroxidase family